MKRYYRDLLLIICIFFIAFSFAFAEELQCCSDKTTVSTVHKETPIVRVTDSKTAHGISQMSKAKGIYGGNSITRPKGKKNRAMSSMTKSVSLALLDATIATLVHFFLY